ncbi:tetratricopeptide repeat protein [Myxococcus sp. Y35]|uniref:tetratricopeptide repeat protein n=1 Tax=Pseudomyxococcus flavus TaxID=3115648 RepID=UPI003CF4BAFE
MSDFREEGDEALNALLRPLDEAAGPARRISREKSTAMVLAALDASALTAQPLRRPRAKRPPVWLMTGVLLAAGAAAAAVWTFTRPGRVSGTQASMAVERADESKRQAAQHMAGAASTTMEGHGTLETTEVSASQGAASSPGLQTPAESVAAEGAVPPPGLQKTAEPSSVQGTVPSPDLQKSADSVSAQGAAPLTVSEKSADAHGALESAPSLTSKVGAEAAGDRGEGKGTARAHQQPTSTARPPVARAVEDQQPTSAARPLVARAAEDLLLKANALRSEGRWKDAESLYLRVIRTHPSSLAAYVARVASGSLRLEHLGDARGALHQFKAALRLHPRGVLDQEAQHGIAEAHRALGNREAERSALEDFLSRHPESPLGPSARARVQELTAP